MIKAEIPLALNNHIETFFIGVKYGIWSEDKKFKKRSEKNYIATYGQSKPTLSVTI